MSGKGLLPFPDHSQRLTEVEKPPFLPPMNSLHCFKSFVFSLSLGVSVDGFWITSKFSEALTSIRTPKTTFHSPFQTELGDKCLVLSCCVVCPPSPPMLNCLISLLLRQALPWERDLPVGLDL